MEDVRPEERIEKDKGDPRLADRNERPKQFGCAAGSDPVRFYSRGGILEHLQGLRLRLGHGLGALWNRGQNRSRRGLVLVGRRPAPSASRPVRRPIERGHAALTNDEAHSPAVISFGCLHRHAPHLATSTCTAQYLSVSNLHRIAILRI